MELIGILILLGLPMAAYNIFIKEHHLELISIADSDAKVKLRGKIFKIAIFVCFGVTIAFHVLVSALGAPALMWSFITIPIVFIFNVIALLIIMEFVNRKYLRGQ